MILNPIIQYLSNNYHIWLFFLSNVIILFYLLGQDHNQKLIHDIIENVKVFKNNYFETQYIHIPNIILNFISKMIIYINLLIILLL